MNFLVGARGRLGRALISSMPPGHISALERSTYAPWTQKNAAEKVARFFESTAAEGDLVYIAAGIIDPGSSGDEHMQVNFVLPQNVIEAASRLGLRVVTFGTIMEEIVGDRTENPYFLSKTLLGRYVEDCAAADGAALHIRMHTLYGGGPPDKFMFLGHFFDSLRRQERFRMSSGTQLREYHHVDDEVQAISTLTESGHVGSTNLNHGAPVRLVELASYLANKFGCSDRLDIGALASSPFDNYDLTFERPPILKDLIFRETFGSVFDYIETWHKHPQQC